MFGGKLFTNHIQPFSHKNCLLAVFGNQLYIFDLNQTQILKKAHLSEDLIKAWTFFQNDNKLIALDQRGNLIEATFKETKKSSSDLWYQTLTVTSKKISKQTLIQDARIIVKSQFQSQYTIYFTQQNALHEYSNGAKNILLKNITKILSASQSYIVCRNFLNPQTIKILSLKNTSNTKQLTFQHSTSITSAIVCQTTLIIGDLKGKIYVIRNYLESQKAIQALTTKYEWHVHQVNALFLEQEYLYSCGEEGTVVMWHLRENKRDFLPRIGTEIQNVIAVEGVVYCMLKDNVITAIDLNNDKLLKHYKTVINPFGFQTKSLKMNSFNGKNISLLSSQSNNRNLLIASGLPGSLQLLNLNDGSNHEIQVLPRNLISRLDQYYPQPHDISSVNLNKDWTLMCCSTFGINHNYLHFYKNQGYNLEYNMISKVENPHEGPIKILVYNNTFITYAENEKTLRFWSKVRRAKKSIIQKEEEYFTCSGQINYRQKNIKNCSILAQQNMLLINYADQIVLIDLKKRQIQIAFKGKGTFEQALLVKRSKTSLNLVLITPNKIFTYELSISEKKLKSPHTIYVFESEERKSVQNSTSTSGNIAFLVKYLSKQVILEFDLNKSVISQSFENQNIDQVSILSICYRNGKLISFGSDSSLTNLSNKQQIVKISAKSGLSVYGMQTEQDSGIHLQNQTFESIHKNYIQRQNVRKKGDVSECLQKIQLEMYPSLGFSFSALCQKMFI